MTYQGHLKDGSSIQKHSAGGLYPLVLFARQSGDRLAWGVITPENQEGAIIGCYDDAVACAESMLIWRRATAKFKASDTQRQWSAYQTSRSRIQGASHAQG